VYKGISLSGCHLGTFPDNGTVLLQLLIWLVHSLSNSSGMLPPVLLCSLYGSLPYSAPFTNFLGCVPGREFNLK